MERLTPQGALKLLVQRAAPDDRSTGGGRTVLQLGVWEMDLATQVVSWSDETYAMFGRSPDTFALSMESYAAHIHPDDQPRMQAVFATLPAPGAIAEVEYRIVRPDGAVRIVLDRCEVVYDADGKAQRCIGVMIDVTEQREVEAEALAVAEELGSIVRVLQEISVASPDLQSALNLMASRAQAVTGADCAVIELVEGDLLVCRAGSGRAESFLGTHIEIRSSLSGAAVREGATILCGDTEADARTDLAAARRIRALSLIAAPLRDGEAVIGVLKVMSEQRHAFSERSKHTLEILGGSLGAVIRQHRHAEMLQRSESQYRLLFENNPQPFLIHDWPGLYILAANRSASELFGYSQEEFLSLRLTDLCAARDLAALKAGFAALQPGERLHATWQQVRRDGSLIDMEMVDDATEFNGAPARILLGKDVTESLRAQRELVRLNRAQGMLSACNEALIRAEDESDLLAEICRIAVEIGDYQIAWVGFAMDDPGKTIRPAAHRGSDTDYLMSLPLTWSADLPAGQGPIGRCVRSGSMVVIEDVMRDESYKPWLARALKKGYRGVRALPLKDHGRTMGVMSLYSAEPLVVGADEVALLLQMADNLAFGIASLRSREERRRILGAVMKVAAGVTAASGSAFFEQLTQNMVEAVGAELAFISRLLPGEPARARTVALVMDGKVRPNRTYALEGSFSQLVLEQGSTTINGDLSTMFPNARIEGEGVQGGIGEVLRNSQGVPVGVLCVQFHHEVDRGDFNLSMLRIFATRAAAELDRQEADLRIRDQASLLDKAQDAIIVRSLDWHITYWNKSAERLYGWTSEEALGQTIGDLIGADSITAELGTERTIDEGEWTGELLQRRKDGGQFTIEGRWTLIRDEQGAPQSILEINTDITARKSAEREIQDLAFYDPLTKLPNRLLLLDRLQHALAAAARTHRYGALLFIDLDNFKTLNDTLGHDQGDLLLREVALRLHGCVREADSLARLGGDEFVVVLEGLAEDAAEAAAQARAIAEKTMAVLNQPYVFAGYLHHSTASIGVTLFNDLADKVNDLLKRADLAMYQAKGAGRNAVRFFDPEMQKLATERVVLEADLRLGLKQNEFVLHYQPQVDGRGRLTGVEALVRWQHGRRGMVSPLEFIPFAEETGLILPLGQWVLESACRQLARWSVNRATAKLQISVNVSARQFRHADFVAQVLAALAATGADPRGLKLELTESLLLDNVEDTIAKMTQLQERGVSFSLDDFGTGYSSLAYLKRLPLDQLKIDQSFVRDVLTDPNDAAIARTIVALAHSLGLSVIAEGVETMAQRDFLARHGCDSYQGYLFSRPLPIDQMETYMAKAGG